MEEKETENEEKRNAARRNKSTNLEDTIYGVRYSLRTRHSGRSFRNRGNHDDDDREHKKKKERNYTSIYPTYVPRTEKSSRIFGKSKTKHDRIVDSPFASRPFVRSFVRRFTTLENSAAYLVPTNNFFSPSALGPILVARLVTTFRS